MALAVAEAQRVLIPGGYLLDIHPQGAPLRLEVWQPHAGDTTGTRAPEDFHREVLGDLLPEAMAADFVASTRAIGDATAAGFTARETRHFDYRFFFDTLDDLTEYLEDNEELELASDTLLEQALFALQHASAPAQLVLVQPVIVTRLQKRMP